MTVQEMAAVARHRLALVHAVPEESAYDHVANAIQVLIGHEAVHPAVWQFSPELRAAEARLFKALFLLGGDGRSQHPDDRSSRVTLA